MDTERYKLTCALNRLERWSAGIESRLYHLECRLSSLADTLLCENGYTRLIDIRSLVLVQA